MLRLLVSAGLVVFLLQYVDYDLWTVKDLKWFYLPIIVASMLGVCVARAAFYGKALNGGSAHLGFLFKISAVYNFFSSIMPFGVGHLSLPYLLKRYHNVSIQTSMAVLIFYNMLRVGTLAGVFIFSGVALGISNLVLRLFLWVGFLFIIVLAGVFFLARSNKMSQSFVGRIKEKYVGNFGQALKAKLEAGKLGEFVGYGVMIVAINAVNVYFRYRFFSVDVPLIGILFLLSSANLFALLPIHGPGHFGTFEATNAFILVGLGYSGHEAIQVSFGVHVTAIIFQAMLALPCYLLLGVGKKNGFR